MDTLYLGPTPASGRQCTTDSITLSFSPGTMGEVLVRAADWSGNVSCTAHHYTFAIPATDAPPLARVEQQFWSGNFGTLLRTEWPETVDMDSTGASYSVRWLGNLDVPPGGARLYAVHDDAARLYVDGVWVTTQGSCTDAENVQAWDVSAGVRAIRVDFINCGSPARMALEWDSATMPRQTVQPEAWKR